MNPIGALFWKEARESAYKVAACAGLAMIVGLVFSQWEFAPADVNVVSHAVGLFGAVLMGMDAIARERSRMTLPFLLCRPLVWWKILVTKFIVGAVGLLVVLASYWGGVFIDMSIDGNFIDKLGFFPPRSLILWPSWQPDEILADVGYGRTVLLWFLVSLIPYALSVLLSTLANHPLKAAVTCLIAAWVAYVCIMIAWNWGPPIVAFYFRLLFSVGVHDHAGILRKAFDASLLIARGAVAVLVAGGILALSCRVCSEQLRRRFQWVLGGIALICAVVLIGMDHVGSPHPHPHPHNRPLGRLRYQERVMDMALKDDLAVVLLDRELSVVDVSDVSAPVQIGRVSGGGWRLERLALSGSRAYVWGIFRGSAGVVIFDLSQPDRARLQAKMRLHPIEKGPTPLLKRVPRLVGWEVWENHLYAGLIRDEFVEMHSFDIQEDGLLRRIQILTLEEAVKHAWGDEWAIQFAGPRAFLTLGHDFMILDLADSGRPSILSRTPLRRFGRSVRYETMVQEFHRQLASGEVPERLSRIQEKAGPKFARVFERMMQFHGKHAYAHAAPSGLGPLTVEDDRAYVERPLPREIAIVDISDPGKPVEVDYLPWTRLPTLMKIEGESAYALRGESVQTYSKTVYGAYKRRETLGLKTRFTYRLGPGIFRSDPRAGGAPRGRDMFIPAGDHIYALLDNHLAIFENPRKTE